MKIASVQLYMKQHTPPKHKDTDKDLVCWCIDALRNAPRCRIAVQQHGDVSYGTGPVPFMKTMGMIVKRPRNNTTQTLKVPDTRKTWKRRARARGVHCSGNTRPDEDVGRVGPRQLDAATSQAPMEEEPDWSCDNQSVDGCLPSHAPTEAMQITEGSSPTKGGQAPEARKEPEEWAQCNKGDKWPRSGEEQDWANDAQSVDDSVHPSIATALESVTTGTSIKGLLLGGRAEQPRTQVESRKEHSADVVRPKAVQLSGIEHRTRSEERVREGAGHSHQVGQSRTNPPRTHHNLILTNKHEQSYLV